MPFQTPEGSSQTSDRRSEADQQDPFSCTQKTGAPISRVAHGAAADAPVTTAKKMEGDQGLLPLGGQQRARKGEDGDAGEVEPYEDGSDGFGKRDGRRHQEAGVGSAATGAAGGGGLRSNNAIWSGSSSRVMLCPA